MAGYDGMDPEFARRLQQLVAASGGRLKITSGYRSVARQQQLWNDAVRKYGSAKAARRYVAPPGKSNHNHGVAADLAGDLKWAHANAERFGIYFPMSWEPWHAEVIGTRGNKSGHTTPPDDHATHGTEGPGDPLTLATLNEPDPHDPKTQVANFMAILATATDDELAVY